MDEFKIGDYVKWETKLNGISIKKVGKIVYIVDPFTTLDEIDYNILKKNISKVFNIICNDKKNKIQTYKSYLILVGEKEGNIPNLHWPDALKLKKTKKRKQRKKIIKKEIK